MVDDGNFTADFNCFRSSTWFKAEVLGRGAADKGVDFLSCGTGKTLHVYSDVVNAYLKRFYNVGAVAGGLDGAGKSGRGAGDGYVGAHDCGAAAIQYRT